MSLDPADPGPVLETYDPRWEPRFDAIHARLKVLWDRADPVRDHDFAAQMNKALIDAHEARYKYLWQYHAALRERFCSRPLSIDPTLHIPLPPSTATRAQMLVHYVNWRENWEYQQFVARLPLAVEWGTGVFAQKPSAGVTRKVEQGIIQTPLMEPLRMTLVVEHHPGTTHVCAVQGPGCGEIGVTNVDIVTDYIAERYLPRPGLLSRLWSRLRGEPAPRLMFYHTEAPKRHARVQPPVLGYELQWTYSLGRTRLERDNLKTQQATPVLRELALALAPEARAGVTLH